MDTAKTPRFQLEDPELFTAHDVLALTGWTYRMLDYHVRQGCVTVSGRPAAGNGSRRLFTAEDVARVRVVKQLTELGAKAAVVRRVLEQLHPDPAQWPPYLFVAPDGVVRRGFPLPDGCWWLHTEHLRADQLTSAA